METCADDVGALAHVVEAKMMRSPGAVMGAEVESYAVIFDGELDAVGTQAATNRKGARSGVLQRVGARLLSDAV